MPDPPVPAKQGVRWPTGLWVRPAPHLRQWIPDHYVGPVWCSVTLIIYAITAAAGLHFVVHPEGITPIWPASGVALAMMTRCPRRYWLWVLAGIVLAEIPANLGTGRPISLILWIITANVCETVLSTLTLTRFGREEVDFSTVRQLLRLVVAAGAANAVTSTLAAGPIVYLGFAPNFWHFWRLWFVADGLGILIVTPVLLSLAGSASRRLSPHRFVEACAILLAAGFSGMWMFSGSSTDKALVFDFPFVLTIPLIIWAALRTNLAVTTLVSMIFATIAVLATVEGRGPFVHRESSMENVLVSLQIVVMAWAACGLAISGAVMQHRRSLQLLSEREERFRRLATSSPAVIVQTDEAGSCTYISERWRDITGQSVDAALGQGWADALHPDDVPRVRTEWRKACEGVSDFVAEYRVRRPSGEIRWVNARLTPLRSAEGVPLGHVGIVIDVTDRMLIEEELEDRRKFNALVADLSATMVDVDADKVDKALRDALVNLSESLDLDRVSLSERSADGTQLHMIFGHFRGGAQFGSAIRMDTLHPWAWQKLNAGECLSLSNFDNLPPESATDKANWISRSIRSLMLIPISIGGAELYVFSVASTTREQKWTDELALRFRVLGETFAHAIVRARAEHDLQESEAMLRHLNTELLRAEEKERRRLATALHDELAQNLFGAVAQLVAMRGRQSADALAPQLDAVISSLDESLRQTRDLTFDLCPPILYELGLVAALSKLCDQYAKKHGMTCCLDAPAALRTMDSDLASLLYQAVRELLVNVVKHAHARRVDVKVEETAELLTLSVTDDGSGLAAGTGRPDRSQSGFGLLNIKERLRTLGGRVEMASVAGSGCTVRLILPLCVPV